MALPIYEENELLIQIAQGDETAFSHLFTAWHHQLGAHVYQIIRSYEHTEEIVQDVFVKIWMSRESLTEITNFKSYLFVMSRNQSISYLRKLSRERAGRAAFEKDTAIGDAGAEDAWKEREHYLTLIDEAIGQLPPQQKKAYLLSRKDRLKHEEIAERLKVSKSTVKSHIQAAVESISRFVREHANPKFLALWILFANI